MLSSLTISLGMLVPSTMLQMKMFPSIVLLCLRSDSFENNNVLVLSVSSISECLAS